jgi:hypothetical protein
METSSIQPEKPCAENIFFYSKIFEEIYDLFRNFQIFHVSIINHVPHLKWLLVILEFQINLRVLNETVKIILAKKAQKTS